MSAGYVGAIMTHVAMLDDFQGFQRKLGQWPTYILMKIEVKS